MMLLPILISKFIGSRLRLPTIVAPLLVVLVGALAVACNEPSTPTPAAYPTATTGATQSISQPSTIEPTPATMATEVPAGQPLNITLAFPADGMVLESGVVRVQGVTEVDAVVAINGVPVDLGEDGSFQGDIPLEEGANSIEVSSAHISGAEMTQYLVVFFSPPSSGPSLDVLFPPDGYQSTSPALQVVGATNLGAVAAVNGDLVDTNEMGIFSATVTLTEGANVIDIQTADVEDQSQLASIVVFYNP